MHTWTHEHHDRAHRTNLTIIFSLAFRSAYWPAHPKTIFTYGFISLVSPRSRHAIQFRSVSWRTLIERPAYKLTAKSKFRPEPWKLSENTGILRKTRGRWQRNNQRGRGVIAPIAFSAVSPLLFARLRLKISRPWTYSALKYRKNEAFED